MTCAFRLQRLCVRSLCFAVLLAVTCSCNCLFGQLLFVPNNNDETLATYIINGAAGNLTEVIPRLQTPGYPTAVTVEPRGKFLYVAESAGQFGGNSVAGYAISPATGALSKVPNSPFAVGGNPIGLSVDPAGKFLYVVNQGGTSVNGFAINTLFGSLTPVPGTQAAAGLAPTGVLVDATGKFLYVTSQGSNAVFAHAIDPGTGALTPIAGSPFPTGAGPSRLTEDAAGKFLFVTNQGGNSVSVYTINATTGALTPVSGSPFPAGTGPTAVGVDPGGNFAYVANGSGDNLSAYSINRSSGALTPLPGSPFSSPRAPYGVLFDPTGQFVYVPNLVSNNVSAFAFNSTSGALTPVPGSPFAAGGGPQRPAAVQFSPPILPPVVAQSALNSASYALPGLPNYGVAQGSMFVVFGQNLGPAAVQQATSFPLPTQLAGTSVTVTVGGVTKNAIMVYTYLTQVAAILPSATPVGDGFVTVTYNNRASATAPIHVVRGSVGLFTRNQAGSGPAIVQNYNSGSDQPLNGLTQSAHPGQTLILWATGLGPVAFDETQPPLVQNVRTDVTVWVGAKSAPVSYSGRSPQFPGVDQINFTLPADVPLGCYVPLALQLGTTPPVMSNFATIAITAQGSVCSDPHGLAAADLALLQTGGGLNIGWIQLLRMNVAANVPGLGSGTGLVDSGWAEFFRWNAATGLSDQGLDIFTGRGTSFGGCSVYTFAPGGSGYIPPRSAFLNAGPGLSLTGPNGSRPLVLDRSGYYDAHKALGAMMPALSGLGDSNHPLAAPFLEPGTITVADGAGGSGVGSFTAALTIPASPVPLAWTNLDAIAASGINRSQGLTFTWTGGDASSEYAAIAGAVFLPDMLSKVVQAASAFVCTQRMDSGRFTVPSWVLSALPASTPGDGTSGMLMAGRAPLLSPSVKFTAPGLDIGYLTFTVSNGRYVAYQ
ncbi:MAG TPA: beta-propeller fold lactonase family protein [Bryobacteraceae bacterium]|nr:beta-propeller fold lactonase family protein [Bryobacteraceae bacterium]